ncbi:LuxR C-terminal-related transcriptional regulator [Paucibacter sp. R3-3]|uniref:LuxR C-terminal-related transcriptional regulator n=1 Tax=Roseateles agri TaxID=3098619 RepID=A0ABU5DB36_9BURK|nr:LuxR C-terminal-related transcriptional regulator [Paucibacter sp. R3-3]MDY0743334.1 LuxR C-terminal-related transcriptional regulator [Paucibacter sp. R3-3]
MLMYAQEPQQRPAPHVVPRPQQITPDHDPIARSTLDKLASALMDQVECGLITCRADGSLIHANRAARRELGLGNSLWLAGDSLRCEAEMQSELNAALNDAAMRQRSRLLLLNGGGAERLTAVAMPIQVDSLGVPAALLMIGRRNVCSPLGLEMLALRHGLTLTERRVLRALIASQSARDIADAHGVAMSTIRSQIQSIRDKVGVRSIEELLLRAAQVPPVSSWHEYRN